MHSVYVSLDINSKIQTSKRSEKSFRFKFKCKLLCCTCKIDIKILGFKDIVLTLEVWFCFNTSL